MARAAKGNQTSGTDRSRVMTTDGYALVAAIVLSIAGCAGPGTFTWVAEVPDAVLLAPPIKSVAVGDVLIVRVFGQESLTTRVVVRERGAMSVPLIGEVLVLGRQTAEISKEIAQRLEPFVNRPYVMTVIEESHIKIVTAGELRRPGTLTVDGCIDLLTAVANAGGLTEFAGESDIYVLRPTASGMYRIRFRWQDLARGVGNASRFRLRDGDQVVVE
jgi:polysaccharide biosynthesis/export protein